MAEERLCAVFGLCGRRRRPVRSGDRGIQGLLEDSERHHALRVADPPCGGHGAEHPVCAVVAGEPAGEMLACGGRHLVDQIASARLAQIVTELPEHPVRRPRVCGHSVVVVDYLFAVVVSVGTARDPQRTGRHDDRIGVVVPSVGHRKARRQVAVWGDVRRPIVTRYAPRPVVGGILLLYEVAGG